MFDMVFSSTKLFFQGKLFQDTALAIRLLVTGAAAATVATVLVGMVAPLWVAAIAGGLVGGLLQPYLYRNIKYA
ncbi:hypothetical protein U4960_07195 [Altererythrobacter sp. H2]|jgi:hypothetical protein|uniref:hypothetical protein n=1 Tax=Sphingomonadales TaxID=204457 RepID=UPI00059D96E9|nr:MULTISPECIES: hypothetical protein [Sphingomonadales]MAK99028.1 hypothetical protein [Citromicrobium sp.]MEA3264979.1 hypothetical protein [Pseudomonadota bacterium]MAO95616.1 hypothetical protein [Citromicrobium sp.]MBD76554.1 hypothetical protein [Citromicrobium sp.]WPZ05079.1 hypothetical protein T8S45_05955 [Blastomonas marina]|tara:strand:- start:183 stop:404 length:222 start_codon:yes stop_codon:yes gene_type:complete